MVNRFLRSLLHTLVSILLIACTAMTVLLWGVNRVVFSETVYSNLAKDTAFTEGMRTYLLDDLEAECLFYDLPFDTVKTVVTAEWVNDLSQEYMAIAYDTLHNGSSTREFSVDPTPYRVVLENFFASLPEKERPLDENVAVTLSKELAQSTQQVLAGGMVNTVLDYGYRFVYGNEPLRRVVDRSGWLAVAVLVLAVLSLLPFGSTWRQRAYATAGSLFLGSTLVFVPLWLLQRYGLAARLALGASPLKLYVTGIVDGMINGMTATAGWIFVGTAVLLVAAVIVLVFHKKTS